MISYTFILIKLMTFWNYLNESINIIQYKLDRFYNYLKDYFYGHNDIWLFINGHSNPLSLNNLNNNINVNWMYDNHTNTFSLVQNTLDKINEYKFSWLSAKITVKSFFDSSNCYEYTIDDFIEKIIIKTSEKEIPSLNMIFMCWCVFSKHWFNMFDLVKFHVIDEMGEEIILDLQKVNTVILKDNKMYIKEDESVNIDSLINI
jgi:hypothetical protein